MTEQLPPPDHMIPELRSSDHTLSFFRELVARDSPRFIALNPIKRGTPYAIGKGADAKTVRDFPALFFLRQTVPIGSNTVAGMTQSNLVIWEWLSGSPDAENVENAEISYLGDAVANPVYARVSTVRRSIYEANPTLTPGTATLTGLIGIKVTNAGSGYTSAPTVAISGGLGATAEAVIDAAGTVTHVIITKESSGYDSASLPTISFSGGGGTGAAATAIVQPKTAILTSQRKREFPDGDPRSLELVQILRTYEVLPGPTVPYARFDDDFGPVQGYRQAVLWTSQAPTSSATGKTTYEARDGSSIVAWKIVESWTLPRTKTSKKTNAKKQVVTVTETREDAATTPATPTALKDVDFKVVGDGTAIETTEEVPAVFDNDTRSIEIPDVTPAWAKALLPTTSTSSEAAAASVADPTLSTGQIRKRVQRTTEKTVQTEITARDTASLPKTRTNKKLTREFGGGLVDTVQTQAVGAQTPSSGGLMVVDSEMEVLGDGTSVLSTSTGEDASWPVLYDYDIDPETGQTILTSYQVVAAGTAGTATSVAGVVTRYKHIDKWRSLKIIATYSTPATRDEQRFGAFSFPALFDSSDLSYSDDCGWFTLGMRAAFSAMVKMRTSVAYGNYTDIGGLTLIPVGPFLIGKGGHITPALMNSANFTYTGDCTGSFTFPASDPDYSDYIGTIQGTEQLVTGESVPTPSGHYRNTSVYVTML